MFFSSVPTPLRKSKKKKALSDEDAALRLQRIYKGFAARKVLKGWSKVIDDDGDVFFKDKDGNLEWELPSIPFHPAANEAEAEAEEAEEEEADEGGSKKASENIEIDEDGTEWQLDGPGGARLKQGWRRCEDETDVWYTCDETGESVWEVDEVLA